LPKFSSIGPNTWIEQPFSSAEAEKIVIGSGCRIGKGCDFGIVKQGDKEGKIIIGNNVYITARCQIFSLEKVTISDHVLIASNVFIVDCSHGYSSAGEPYNLQPFEQCASVEIGRGSWIGQNAVIMQGVTIGEQCIIGANSVVTKSIPARSIAAGSPARVVKVWDDTNNKWVKP
jgi:acetyltransferase-like isoleucine patch superfamily enzyme